MTTYTDDYAGRLCDRYEAPLLVIARLGDRSTDELLQRVSEETKGPGRDSRADLARIAESNDGVGVPLGRDFVDLLIDVVVTSRASRTPLPQLVAQTATELSRVNADVNPAVLSERLTSLARTPVVASLAIDEDLLAENAAVYIDSRILRDFRPAYDEDITGTPVGISRYASQQRLRIRYWSAGRERVFEITMRDEDLDDLERWVFRAKSKLSLLPEPVRRAADPGV